MSREAKLNEIKDKTLNTFTLTFYLSLNLNLNSWVFACISG